MTAEQLNAAIDTAARHCREHYGSYETAKVMLEHLKFLLEIQKKMAFEDCPK